MPLTTENVKPVKLGEPEPVPGEPISSEVRDVCERLGIQELLPVALRLIEKHFQPEQIRFEPLRDPEEDSEWLGIRADVRGSIEEVLRRYKACKQEWFHTVPMAQLGLVRFLYNILEP